MFSGRDSGLINSVVDRAFERSPGLGEWGAVGDVVGKGGVEVGLRRAAALARAHLKRCPRRQAVSPSQLNAAVRLHDRTLYREMTNGTSGAAYTLPGKVGPASHASGHIVHRDPLRCATRNRPL